MKKIDMTNQQFGKLTVIKQNGSCNSGVKWLCICECGNEVTVIRGNLLNGHNTSCGCFAKEVKTTHGMSNTKLYKNWARMLQRCENPKTAKYKSYGERGISVCERWHDFSNFFADIGYPPSDKHTLDRIDNNGNYCPSNVRWADKFQQANNCRSNKYIIVDGDKKTQAEWSRICGISQQNIYLRLKNGWSVKKSLGLD
jgi:hypothetical protein